MSRRFVFIIANSADPDEMLQYVAFCLGLKDIYFVIYGIISEFTDKGEFHYRTKLKGPQVGNYLYTTQFLLLR